MASIIVTLRSLFHPLDVHDTTARSSNAVSGSGPSRFRRRRTLRRSASFLVNHFAVTSDHFPVAFGPHPRAAVMRRYSCIVAACIGRSLTGRMSEGVS